MTPTIGEEVSRLAERFASAGIETARLDARLLVASVIGEGGENVVIGYPERTLDEVSRHKLSVLADRRASREPVAHILGKREFWSLDFEVSPATLAPRCETETLITTALAWRQRQEVGSAPTILDLGTGSGCLLLALLKEIPDARGLGVDISAEALSVAYNNAKRLGLSKRADFIKSDWGKEFAGRKFDIILSNPPYIPDQEIETLAPEVARFDPHKALSGGDDGLDKFREIIPQLSGLLSAKGAAFLEVGQGQAEAVAKMAQASWLQVIEINKDLSGIGRCVVVER
jgi:release factor glutamine methyltransferase